MVVALERGRPKTVATQAVACHSEPPSLGVADDSLCGVFWFGFGVFFLTSGVRDGQHIAICLGGDRFGNGKSPKK